MVAGGGNHHGVAPRVEGGGRYGAHVLGRRDTAVVGRDRALQREEVDRPGAHHSAPLPVRVDREGHDRRRDAAKCTGGGLGAADFNLPARTVRYGSNNASREKGSGSWSRFRV